MTTYSLLSLAQYGRIIHILQAYNSALLMSPNGLPSSDVQEIVHTLLEYVRSNLPADMFNMWLLEFDIKL